MSDPYKTDVQKSNFEGIYDASSVMVTVSGAVAIYSSLELVLLILTTFKRWRGLYFWSMCLCNLGVLAYAFGFMMVYFELSALWFAKALNDTGWAFMVVCQSLVLYSRLSLTVLNTKILKAVKWMIIVDSVILVPFPIIFDYGNTFTNLEIFPKGYFYIEHVQITVFSLQECIISSLYIIRTIDLLRYITKANARDVVWQMLIINLIIIPMDIVLIICQFKKLQLYQEGIKVFVYAVKLKLELHVLSKLVDFIRENDNQRTMTLDVMDSNTIPGQGKVNIQQEQAWNAIHCFGAGNTTNLTGVALSKDSRASTHSQRGTSTKPGRDSIDWGTVVHSSREVEGDTDLSLQYSASSQRLKGREADVLYANALRF